MKINFKLETPVIVALLSLVSAVIVALIAAFSSFCQYIVAPALEARRKAKQPANNNGTGISPRS